MAIYVNMQGHKMPFVFVLTPVRHILLFKEIVNTSNIHSARKILNRHIFCRIWDFLFKFSQN